MQRPEIQGLHHLTLPSTNILTTSTFYCQILGLHYLPRQDVRAPPGPEGSEGTLLAITLSLSHNLTSSLQIEIRYNEVQARAQRGWSPLTFGVKTKRELENWRLWFERCQVRCSHIDAVIRGWVLCCEDPDGRIVKLYSEAEADD